VSSHRIGGFTRDGVPLDPHGVLVVDKPVGPTSHDVVAQARRLFGIREVGHAGTLDPGASGVLVLLLGEATKLSQYLTAQDKRYLATIEFGRATDTWDAQGKTVQTATLVPGQLDPYRVEHALEAERMRTAQTPPLFSAIQIGGVRAHRASRRGVPVTLGPRSVSVQSLELVSCSEQQVSVRLTVSKGYYVRSLAHDLGQRMGAPALLAQLRRVASGPFSLDDAVAWPPAAPPALLGMADAARRSLPTAELTERGRGRALHGQSLTDSDFLSAPPQALSAWLSQSGELVALGQASGSTTYQVVRGFRYAARAEQASASVSARPAPERAGPTR
jgi:tRNA pseudouridine55 synthase